LIPAATGGSGSSGNINLTVNRHFAKKSILSNLEISKHRNN
jgi:hypothetical protein